MSSHFDENFQPILGAIAHNSYIDASFLYENAQWQSPCLQGIRGIFCITSSPHACADPQPQTHSTICRLEKQE
jgi:hypothetical protein